MLLKNVVLWNSLISSYINHNKFSEALDLLLQMQSEWFVPDSYTYVSILLASSKLGNLEFGKYVHYVIRDWSQLQVIVSTALVDMYEQCGDIDRSFNVLTKMGNNNKDVFCL
ncbi:Pentatricopeptide repeat-containing protein At2g42920, chloroplastic [Linum grandiflorum]